MTSFFEAFAARLSRLYVRIPLAIICTAFAATVLMAPYAIRLFQNVKTDFAALLPKNHPSVVRVQDMGKRFGTVKNLEIVFETKNKGAVPRFFAELADKIRKIPGVVKVRYKKPGYDFLSRNKLLYLSISQLKDLEDGIDREIQKRKLGGLYMDFESEDSGELLKVVNEKSSFAFGSNYASPYITNSDETVFIFEVFPEAEVGSSVSTSRDFLNRIQDFMRAFKPERFDPDIKFAYSGGIKSVVEEYESVMRDLSRAGFISGALLILFMILYFRNVALTIATFIPLIFGMAWAFGLSYFIVGQLNMITAFLFSVLAGVGIENGIHLTTRYFEERRDGHAPEEAARIMLGSTGRPALIAALTTMGTMSVLLISRFRGFSEFGGIMALGILAIFACYVFMLAPLLIVLERVGVIRRVSHLATHLVDPLFFMKRWTKMKYAEPILLVSLIWMGVSGWAMVTKVKFDNNFAALKAQSRTENELKSKTETVYQAKSFPALMLVDNARDAKLVRHHFEQLEKRDRDPTVGQVITVHDLIPEHQPEKIGILARIHKLVTDGFVDKVDLDEKTLRRLEDLKRATSVQKPFGMVEVPPELKELFYGRNRSGDQQFVFIRPRAHLNLEDGKDAIAFAADTRDVRIGNKTYHAVSHNLIFADIILMLTRDMKIVIVLALLTAFFLLWLDFRKLVTAVLVLLPLVVGLFWMFGIMWLTRLDVNLFNIVVFPCLLGMSIDNATHIFYRTRESGIENMMQVLRLTGNAVVMSVVTTVSGFVGLIVAQNNGLHSTGVLAVIGLATTLVSGLIFFPALLQFLRAKKVPF